jgi:hypothetical protein
MINLETALGVKRPVTFKLKSDATGTRQYGLIAEEVAHSVSGTRNPQRKRAN